jgi:hypothetical protein
MKGHLDWIFGLITSCNNVMILYSQTVNISASAVQFNVLIVAGETPITKKNALELLARRVAEAATFTLQDTIAGYSRTRIGATVERSNTHLLSLEIQRNLTCSEMGNSWNQSKYTSWNCLVNRLVNNSKQPVPGSQITVNGKHPVKFPY